MKILEVIYRYPPAIAGSGKVAYELSKEFVKMGHDVTVATSTSLNNNDTRGFSTGRRFSLKSNNYNKHREAIDGVKIYRFNPLFQFWTFGFNPGLKRFIKENSKKFDIVHVHSYQSYEAYIVSKLCKKYVLNGNDIISHYPGFFAFIKKMFDILMGRRILKKASGLVALTKENVVQYNEIFPCGEKIKVIPPGIENYKKTKRQKDLRSKLGNPKKIILFLGRIVEYKGCQFIIDALPEIIKEYPDTVAAFVGIDGGYTNRLKQKAESMGLADKCFFSGAVDDIEPYLNIGDVFVFPSRGEGFGLAPVEAMSVGVPAVLADMGGLKYVLKDIGGLPIDMNKDISTQISKNVLKIFNKELNLDQFKIAEENAKKYRWDEIAKKTLNFLKDCSK